MAETQLQPSFLLRYHPAALAATAIATGCSIYMLYNAYSGPRPGAGLHRSNAVHRPRRDRQQVNMEVLPATSEAPLGRITLRQGDSVFTYNLAHPPAAEELRRTFGAHADALVQDVTEAALDAVLLAYYSAADSLQTSGLSGELDQLLRAMLAHDDDQIRQAAQTLKHHLAIHDSSDEELAAAVERFLDSEQYNNTAPAQSGSENGDVPETEEGFGGIDAASNEPSQSLRALLYYIAENSAKSKAVEHRGVNCEGCNQFPIRGVRWHCLNCPDFDFCSTCERQVEHKKTHVFAKIKIPLPMLVYTSFAYNPLYPGNPDLPWSPPSSDVKKRLCQEHEFEEPQIDAFLDQFVCYANMPWRTDPSGVRIAIDATNFRKAIVSEQWSGRFAPNVVHDRIHAFYDSDRDGLVGFEEFVSAQSYLKGPKRFASLHRALQGYDLDEDGYISRADFVRLLRAKFQIQKYLVDELIDGLEVEQSRSASNIIRSGLPLSSTFSNDDIPQGEERPRNGKAPDAFGDLQPAPGTETILDDSAAWPESALPVAGEGALAHAPHLPFHTRTHHASRFEELFNHSEEEHDLAQSEAEAHFHAYDIQSDEVDASRSQGEPASTYEAAAVPDAMALELLVEEGWNKMLDPIFKERESEDSLAITTRGERTKWRAHINRTIKARAVLSKPHILAAKHDPLVATALKSTEQAQSTYESAYEHLFTGEVIPTDYDSLTQREEDLARRPLEEMLSATGYSVTDGEDLSSRSSVSGQPETSIARPDRSGLDVGVSESAELETGKESPVESSHDPTWPQARPNTLATSKSELAQAAQAHGDESGHVASSVYATTAATEQPPSDEYVAQLVHLDEVDQSLKRRGGPGRLSYLEIEALAVADASTEIRGLIKSWLEWASF